jgi:hypothetical protein
MCGKGKRAANGRPPHLAKTSEIWGTQCGCHAAFFIGFMTSPQSEVIRLLMTEREGSFPSKRCGQCGRSKSVVKRLNPVM